MTGILIERRYLDTEKATHKYREYNVKEMAQMMYLQAKERRDSQ